MILRFFITVGFLLSMASAFGSFSIYQSYQAEHGQRLESEKKYMQSQDELAVTKDDLTQQKAMVTDLQSQMQVLTKDTKSLKTQVAEKDTEISAVKIQLESKTQETKNLQAQIEVFKKKVLAASDATAAGMSESGETLSPTSASAAGENEASAPVVAEASEGVASETRILTVNRKFNFIVVNLGLQDGIRMGDKLQVVKKDGTQKALAAVEKLYDKFSAATLLSEEKGDLVNEGDPVRKV